MAASMLGFDIGSNQLKIAYWDGNAVKKLISADMPDNMVKNESIVSFDAMADFIKETLKSANISAKRAAIILPSQATFVRRFTVPYMTKEQLMYNLPYEFRDFLSEAKDRYFYDYQISKVVNGEDGKPKEYEIHAASVSKENIEKYKEMFRRAGLKLKIALPREVAYMNCIGRVDAEGTGEYAILDLGHLSSRLDIFTGTTFETTRTIDLGVKDVVLAVSDAEGVDEHVAGTHVTTNYKECQGSTAAREIYDAIAADLRKAINFYGFSNRNSNLSDIYLCGGGANIAPFVETIKNALEDMNLHMAEELLPEIKDEEANPAAFMAAIGAMLQTTRFGSDNINLIMKEKSKLPVLPTILGVILVLAAAAAFCKFLVMDRFAKAEALKKQAYELQKENDRLDEYLVDYDDIAVKYAKYSVSWMNDKEQARVERDEIMKVIDEELKDYCTITTITINENTASVNIKDCSLEQVSICIDKMLQRMEVGNVVMKSAVTDDSTGILTSAVIEFTMMNAGAYK